jgi:hypothetical protein
MAHNPGDLPTEKPPGSGMWFWADGTPVTPAEGEELKRQAEGAPPTEGSGIDTGARGTGPLDWLLPKQLDSDAPGATLDTGQADESRDRTEGLLAQLQQQAATGGGAWEKTLADATQRAQATASALGQNQANTGGDYQSALMNIGNAQSAASQRAVGQGNILREQSKANAQDLLGQALTGIGGQDVQESANAAAARQGLREANTALVQGARKTIMDVGGGAGQALVAGASDGGRVPGRPVVGGDDPRNDTVPAMLSPEEIVVPRSASRDPDKAAAFARAVAMRHGAKGYAEGGDIDEKGNPTGTRTINFDQLLHGTDPQGASIENGGLLNDENATGVHADVMGLMGQLAARAGGAGGTAPQTLTNDQDETVAGAMQQTQNSARASQLLSAIAQQQRAGGEAAATAGNEQAKAQRSMASTGTAQRANDLALARAKQQAAWRNTELNAGLSLDNQALMGRLLSGTAQGVAALGHAGFGADSGDSYSLDDSSGGDTVGDTSSAQTHDLGSLGSDDEQNGGGDTEGDRAGLAFGGEVPADDEHARARRFLQLLRRAA